MVLSQKITVKIKDLLQKHPQGLSITGIVKEVNIGRSTAGRYLETLLASGHVDMRLFGMAKIYTLSHRVPSSSVLSISSELILQLDSHLRIIYVNEPFVEFLNTSREELIGKNIQYSVLVPVLDDIFGSFLDRVRNGIKGVEWKGELFIESRGTIFTCRIAQLYLTTERKAHQSFLKTLPGKKKTRDGHRRARRNIVLLLKRPMKAFGSRPES